MMTVSVKQDVANNRGHVIGTKEEIDGQNFITLNVGDRTPSEIADLIRSLPEINEVIFGSRSGFDGWNGVVREVRTLQKEFKEVAEGLNNIRGEVAQMRKLMNSRPNYNSLLMYAILVLLLIVAAVLILMLVAIFKLLGNDGAIVTGVINAIAGLHFTAPLLFIR